MELLQNLQLKSSSRVLLRLDLNLPQDEKGNFTDLFRLESSLPTLQFLLQKDCTIFIISHLGSPKGQKKPSLSLAPLAELLTKKLKHSVQFIANPFNSELKLNTKPGIFLLENLRFWPEEESNQESNQESASKQFAKSLIAATGSNYFVQDGFGVCHRAHASTVQLPKLLPSAAGLLLQKELAGLRVSPNSNLSLIVGGAKVESKLPVIQNFLTSAQTILTGGVLANTLLKASGQNIAASLFSQPQLSLARKIIKSSTHLQMPLDYLVADSPNSPKADLANSQNLHPKNLILDLGPQTIQNYIDDLQNSQTIIWAGTLGFAENPVFSGSSLHILHEVLKLKDKNPKLKIIIGGGDTVDFIRANLNYHQLAKIDHLSTGGGASLQLLAGQELPGISALNLSSKPESKLSLSSGSNLVSKLTPKKDSSSKLKSNSKLKSSLQKPIIAVNLKANFNLEQASSWLKEVLKSPQLTSNHSSQPQLIIAAPNIFLEEFSNLISKAKLNNPPKIYAEDISSQDSGAHTGGVSAAMLQGIASGTIIGHSERRLSSSETNQIISQKVQQALKNSLNLILCIGSGAQDIKQHQAELYEQLSSILPLINISNSHLLLIAYEPVFAIGTGHVPNPTFLTQQLKFIKLTLQDFGLNNLILYGGSVDHKNFQQILSLGFSGVLIGSAALKASNLQKVLAKT